MVRVPENKSLIFHVNWYRTTPDGEYLWPGFDHNIRVIEWILGRVEHKAQAHPTPIGRMPPPEALDVSGLDMPRERLEQLLAVDVQQWRLEAERDGMFLRRFGSRLPRAIADEHRALIRRLDAANMESSCAS